MCESYISDYCNIKHGRYKTTEYFTWGNMLDRCRNTNNTRYYDYGGRGISVCRRWSKSFENFYKDMGDRPSKNHSIDRIDNNGPYAPWNCKWSTKKEQSRNTRGNIYITYRGVTKCIAEWSEYLGINSSTIRKRLNRGWSVEKAMQKEFGRFKRYEFNGENLTLVEISKKIGVKYMNLRYYFISKNLSLEEAIRITKERG